MKALPVAVGLAIGLAAGALWTWSQANRYRAEARVLVRPPSAHILPAVEALAESSAVESNIAQTLHLSTPPDISASGGSGGVLTLGVEAGSRERARQIDAEAVVLLGQKVGQRFGAGVTATVLDPAHATEQTSPTPGRNLLIAGLAGLLVGAAVAGVRGGLPRVAGAPRAADGAAERRLRKRIAEVAQRERALARRAGELAAREHELAAAPREPAPRRTDLEPAPEQPAPPEPAPPRRPRDTLNLNELERYVESYEGASPAQLEEWRTYLFFLREHADSDGSLPPSFAGLVNDVFGDRP
ncbi:MAG TPA: hypothetical protein VNR63_05970 [Gaiellaceae bacterium]|nr:hypothetical protein [Gaiellaceae bacterium]